MRFPFVVAKVGVSSAGGQNKVIEIETCSTGKRDLPRGGVEADDFIHHYLGVALVAQDGADGLGNVGRRQHRQRHLVKQRLKGVMVAAIDHGDVDLQARDPFGRMDPRKACADDNDTGTAGRWRDAGNCWFASILPCRFAHGMPFCRGFGFFASNQGMLSHAGKWQRLTAD